jgi:23S rRNA (adenine2503-C2)-methyltransferase
MTTDRLSIFDQTPESLSAWMADIGEKAYRATQVLEWAYSRGAMSFDAMSNLSKGLRGQLAESFCLYESEVVHEQRSSDGTIKSLLRWSDGATTECVMIPDGERRTACISTQVGCAVGCVFCASGLEGLARHLSRGQIVEQAMRVSATCPERRLSNVVFMGLGEPLHNFDATVGALRTLNAAWGMGIGARKVTVSTVGLPSRIKQLADEEMQVTLAISLHAPNDALRREIIPWAKSVGVADLVEAAKYYFDKTGREVTLEYILLGGLNDRARHAVELASVAKKMRSNINLIRYNPVEGLPYERPTAEATRAFQEALRERGVNAHVRKSRGLDIDGACGQLRRRLG